jgi:hypothetical protein
MNEDEEAACLEVQLRNSRSTQRVVRKLWYRNLNPVLTQFLLLFWEGDSAEEIISVVGEQTAKTWYNSVYNPSGAKENPITFCIH